MPRRAYLLAAVAAALMACAAARRVAPAGAPPLEPASEEADKREALAWGGSSPVLLSRACELSSMCIASSYLFNRDISSESIARACTHKRNVGPKD